MVLTRVVNKTDLHQDNQELERDTACKKCYFCGGEHLCRECPQKQYLHQY